MPMINEAVYCLMEGVGTPKAIDTVMKLGMNHPMGPLALADLIGLDTCLAILEVLHDGLGDPKYRPCPLLGSTSPPAGSAGRRSAASMLVLRLACQRRRIDVLGPHSAHRRAARDPDASRASSPTREIAPHSAQWDRDAYFEPSLVEKLGELGFLGMMIPEEYDGLGLDTLHVSRRARGDRDRRRVGRGDA